MRECESYEGCPGGVAQTMSSGRVCWVPQEGPSSSRLSETTKDLSVEERSISCVGEGRMRTAIKRHAQNLQCGAEAKLVFENERLPDNLAQVDEPPKWHPDVVLTAGPSKNGSVLAPGNAGRLC